MKKFESLITEMKQVVNNDELNSCIDLFDFGYSHKKYNKYQKQIFQTNYKEVENRVIADEIFLNNKDFNYLRLLSIIKGADEKLKDNIEALTNYFKGIDSSMKSKQKFA